MSFFNNISKIRAVLSLVTCLSCFILHPVSCVSAAVVEVVLVNALSGAPVSSTKVTAKKKLADGKLKWIASGTTDEAGSVIFDLEGLGSGSTFVFAAKVYNGITSYSGPVKAAGRFVFPVGALEVLVLNGADRTPLPDFKVTAKERLPDGKYKWKSSGRTDAQGLIRFDLEGLENGRTYVLAAKSPQDGTYKYSQEISSGGRITFLVGNRPLVVHVKNALTLKTLPGLKVTAARKQADGKLKWAMRHETDANGTAIFDLDGLGQGISYVLYSKPFNGGTVYSREITAPGSYDFLVGAIPVTLLDADRNIPMAGQKLILYQLGEDGKLKWKKSGMTDQQGVVVFDITGLGQGGKYTVRAENPFDNKKKYYSPWITQKGEVQFIITRDGDYSLDSQPPWVGISNWTDGSKVPAQGFELSGRVTDNQKVEGVHVEISRPTGETILLPVSEEMDGRWHLFVEPGHLSAGESVTVTAIALDRAHNTASSSLSLDVVNDNQAPNMDVGFPGPGQGLERNGFVFFGDISDNTGIERLDAALSCRGSQGESSRKIARVDKNAGKWVLAYSAQELPGCQEMILELTATDIAGNRVSRSVPVTATNTVLNSRQLANRITFGATAWLIHYIGEVGPDAYLSSQLSPWTVDDSWFEEHLGSLVPEKEEDLAYMQFVHSLYSKRQLQEVMTWFWENHFSTDFSRHYHVEYEFRENSLFRENALGKFRDLLEISAKSPAMLYFLDNVSNRKENPNENYAREIMELHTLGVDNGYTQQDIVEVARCFTGWRVKDGEFFFDERRHDYGEKHVLGHVIPSGQGIMDGQEVLDILANHPGTSRFICKKLLVYLVSDEPRDELMERCAMFFQATEGDIGQVVSMILHSREFNDPANFHNKVKTPLEFTAGLVRNLQAVPSPEHLRRAMSRLGMRLFRYPLPTGWPETGEKWVNSNQYLLRLSFVNQVIFNDGNERYCSVDIRRLFKEAGLTAPEEIVDFVLSLALSGDYTDLERQVLLDCLTGHGTESFDLDDPSSDEKLRRLMATLFSFPEYQLQ